MPGTGEGICRPCDGTGRMDAKQCDIFTGTGKVMKAVGGAWTLRSRTRNLVSGKATCNDTGLEQDRFRLLA